MPHSHMAGPTPLPPSRPQKSTYFFIPYSRCCTNTSWSFWKVSSPFHYSNIFRRTSARQISQRNGTRLPGSAEWKRALFPVSWKRLRYIQLLYCSPLNVVLFVWTYEFNYSVCLGVKGRGFFVDLKNHTLLVTLTGHMTLQILIF